MIKSNEGNHLMKENKRTMKQIMGIYEPKHRVTMHKSKKQWVAKGLLFGTLLMVGGAVQTTTVQAEVWAPNTVEQISSRITEGQKSIKMIEGDTVYNIGLAINIKDPMQLLFDNGFTEGDQYTMAVGTEISWDGNHITVKDPNGNVIGDKVVSNTDKHNPNATVAGQTSDVPAKSVKTDNKGNIIKNMDKGGNNGSSVKPKEDHTKPTTPSVKPDEKEDGGTNPVKPVDPTNPEKDDTLKKLEVELKKEQTKLEKLQAELDQLKIKLASIQQENQEKIAALELKIADLEAQLASMTGRSSSAEIKEAQAAVDQAESKKAGIEISLASKQAEKAQLEERMMQVQTKLETLQSEGASENNAEQWQQSVDECNIQIAELTRMIGALNQEIINLSTQLETVQAEYDTALAHLNELENQEIPLTVEELEASIAETTKELEETKTKALEQEKELQAQIDVLELKVAEQEKKVADLEAKISKLKGESDTAAALKKRQDYAKNEIANMEFLPGEAKSTYTYMVEQVTTVLEVDHLLDEARDLNQKCQEGQIVDAIKIAKKNAKREIAVMETLTTEERSYFNWLIDEADSVEAVETHLEKMWEFENNRREEITTPEEIFEKIKLNAMKEIDEMTNLPEGQREMFKKEISEAKTLEEVDLALGEAGYINGGMQSTELKEAKEDAQNELAMMETLTKEEYSVFSNRIVKAISLQEVEEIIEEARVIETERALEQAKKEAREYILSLPYFDYNHPEYTNEELLDIRLADCKTLEDVEMEINMAEEINELWNPNRPTTDDDKDSAINHILGYRYLSEEERAEYEAKIESAELMGEIFELNIEMGEISDGRLNEAHEEINQAFVDGKITEQERKDYTWFVDHVDTFEALKLQRESFREDIADR